MECIPLQAKQSVVTQFFRVSNHKVTDRSARVHFHELLHNKRTVELEQKDPHDMVPGKQRISPLQKRFPNSQAHPYSNSRLKRHRPYSYSASSDPLEAGLGPPLGYPDSM